MQPAEVQHDVFSCLSRNDIEALQLTCVLLDEIISAWSPKAPRRTLSRITLLGDQIAAESSASATDYFNAEMLLAVMRASYTKELAVGMSEVLLEFAEHAVSLHLVAARASCTVCIGQFKQRAVDDRCMITFGSNLTVTDEDGHEDPVSACELSIFVTDFESASRLFGLTGQLRDVGFQLIAA